MSGAEAQPSRADPLRLACPHCGLQAMSVWRKWGLTCFGWEKPVACHACGQSVEVNSFPVMAWTAPFILFCVLAAALMALGWRQHGLVLVLAGVLLLTGIGGLLFGIPLDKRGRTDPQAVQRARACRESGS
ncbi:hypothetical protein EII20_00660 [Comamonadaceae bacterium OH2545_COT-014]|nr:hypothetical protein EII20_00660 [Comamonadaceae bacterium OH2545_COT-014]